eukprot:6683636-Prymnesium_polylepis.1
MGRGRSTVVEDLRDDDDAEEEGEEDEGEGEEEEMEDDDEADEEMEEEGEDDEDEDDDEDVGAEWKAGMHARAAQRFRDQRVDWMKKVYGGRDVEGVEQTNDADADDGAPTSRAAPSARARE